MSVVSLIKENILKSKGYSNFSEEEYQEDKNKIFNIKSKLSISYFLFNINYNSGDI